MAFTAVVTDIATQVSTVVSDVRMGPAGPTGPAGGGAAAELGLVTGGAAVAIGAGQAVTRLYTLAGSPAVGLAIAAAASGASVSVRSAGRLTLADWTAATGGVSLQAGAPYYLHPTTPGLIQVAVPVTAGQYLQYVGSALTTDTLLIGVLPPVKL